MIDLSTETRTKTIIPMKKLLIPALLLAAIGSAHATTVACACDKKKDKEQKESSLVETTHTYAGTDTKDESKKCGGKCSGEKAIETQIFAA